MSEAKVDRRISAGARVTLTVEVSNLGAWGADCTVAQVREQAIESALSHLGHALKDGQRFRIIGEPKVTGVLTRDES